MTPFKPFTPCFRSRTVVFLSLRLCCRGQLPLNRPLNQPRQPRITPLQLAAIEKTIDDKRKELGIPGTLARDCEGRQGHLSERSRGERRREEFSLSRPTRVSRSVQPRKHSQRCSP